MVPAALPHLNRQLSSLCYNSPALYVLGGWSVSLVGQRQLLQTRLFTEYGRRGSTAYNLRIGFAFPAGAWRPITVAQRRLLQPLLIKECGKMRCNSTQPTFFLPVVQVPGGPSQVPVSAACCSRC
jgi:hypothetical protein